MSSYCAISPTSRHRGSQAGNDVVEVVDRAVCSTCVSSCVTYQIQTTVLHIAHLGPGQPSVRVTLAQRDRANLPHRVSWYPPWYRPDGTPP